MKISILLENGLFFEGEGFGAEGTTVGEIVFNTAITGYQEIITDPSYAGQFVLFTTPEIGNVGINGQDMESSKAHCKGIFVRSFNKEFSNFRGEQDLDTFLKSQNVMGISEIDTRFLTKTLRKEGAMMMVASTKYHTKEALEPVLKSSPRIEDINYIDEVSTKESYIHNSGKFDISKFDFETEVEKKAKIVAVDFGVKRNILNELSSAGVEVEVVPNKIEISAILEKYNSGEIKGVFLSNGPGDPLVLKREAEMISELVKAEVPMFGICLGHQLLSIANGYETEKLKFGHHGGNHPVKNLKTGAVEITSQNHNYSVPNEIENIAEVSHRNLFDNTIEGLVYKNSPIFSVQHHPEASPGPHESNYIFQQFVEHILKS
ncbi:carbamoyl-phosphate synthase, small subunit [Thiovulum sp. ES]|nr:carbamoyl-phosphate synthase, small subunit [Thiovulum sp. ES]